MPWVNQDMCAGCGICVDYCPTSAISQEKTGEAIIDDDKCIRCGKCHIVCPKDAVRHDSEKIPELVEQNKARSFYQG
jgi:ferredoxin